MIMTDYDLDYVHPRTSSKPPSPVPDHENLRGRMYDQPGCSWAPVKPKSCCWWLRKRKPWNPMGNPNDDPIENPMDWWFTFGGFNWLFLRVSAWFSDAWVYHAKMMLRKGALPWGDESWCVPPNPFVIHHITIVTIVIFCIMNNNDKELSIFRHTHIILITNQYIS